MIGHSGRIALIVIFLVVTLVSYIFLFVVKQSPSEYSLNSPVKSESSPPVSESFDNRYHARISKINFWIPDDAKINEKFRSISIDTRGGTIISDFNGTNFENVKDHYASLKGRNRITPLTYREGTTGKYDYVVTTDEYANDPEKIEKIYFIYADYGIYTFSTYDQELFPVLDRIIESFEYEP